MAGMESKMRRREIVQSASAWALAGAVPALRAAELPLPAIGSRLALVDVPLFDGGMFRAKEMQGQVVLLYWWASWCPFCAVQTPLMQKLWDAQRSRGLKMLGLSVDKKEDAARKYLTDRKYTFPAGHSTPQIQKVLPKPGKGLPITCVRGRDGRVVMAEAGQLFPEDIEQIARFL